jgi:hypothetical protein
MAEIENRRGVLFFLSPAESLLFFAIFVQMEILGR